MSMPVRTAAAAMAAAGLALALPGAAFAQRTARTMPGTPSPEVKAGVDAWGKGDYKAAVGRWRGPAVAGDADAQFNMGQAYKLGKGVPVDMAMAEEWYRKSATQGHPQAEDNYGLALFMNGKRAEAVPWLERSSARGEPRTQYVLGAMLFNADGVPKDWVRAYALMVRSSQSGLAQGVQTLAQMDRYIPAEQRQQGLALARDMDAESQRPQLAQNTAAAMPGPSAYTPAPAYAPAPPPVRETNLPPSSVAEPEPEPQPAAPPPVRQSGVRPGVVHALPPPPRSAPERQPDVVAAPPPQMPGDDGADYAGAPSRPMPVRDTYAPARPRPLPETYVPPASRPMPEYQPLRTRPAPPMQVAAPPPRAAPPRVAAAAAGGRWRVQLGAFRDRGNADSLWRSLSRRVDAFSGRQPYLVTAGAFTRLQVGPFASSAEAARACSQVKPTGTPCVVVGS